MHAAGAWVIWPLLVASASGWIGPEGSVGRHSSGGLEAHTKISPTTSDDEDGAPSTARPRVVEGGDLAVDLQAHTSRPSPAEEFRALADACDRLGVDARDAYGDFDRDAESSHLRRFEAEVARCFGKEDGVFCLSGGMAQSIALRIHSGRNRTAAGAPATPSFACDATSHLLLHEHEAFHRLLGLEAAVLGRREEEDGEPYAPEALNDGGCYGMEPLRASHLRALLRSPTEGAAATNLRTHPSRMRVSDTDITTVMLELPHRELGGKLTPWDEVEDMSRLCARHDVQFHCDGARIFEASAGYGCVTVCRRLRSSVTSRLVQPSWLSFPMILTPTCHIRAGTSP